MLNTVDITTHTYYNFSGSYLAPSILAFLKCSMYHVRNIWFLNFISYICLSNFIRLKSKNNMMSKQTETGIKIIILKHLSPPANSIKNIFHFSISRRGARPV